MKDVTRREGDFRPNAKTSLLLGSIQQISEFYLQNPEPALIFKMMLEKVVEISQSQYGFLDEVVLDEGGIGRTHRALSGISAESGAEQFPYNRLSRNALFSFPENSSDTGAVTGEAVISNTPAADPLLKDFSSLHSLMGIPLYNEGKLMAVAVVINRKGGYSLDMMDFLTPLLTTLATITVAIRRTRADRMRVRQLHDREIAYKTLIENFPNGAVLLYDRELRVRIADGNGLAEVGLDGRAMEGKTIWEIFPEDTCNIIEPGFRDALDGRQNVLIVPFADRIYRVYMVPVEDDNGRINTGMVMTQDITQQRKMEETLRNLAESTMASGDDFFYFVVEKIVETTGISIAVIAEIDPGNAAMATTLAIYENSGKILDNFTCRLKNGPCEHFPKTGPCFYPKGVRQLFPENKMLANLAAESFCGIPLRDRSGNVIGILATIGHEEMSENPQMLSLLNSFAARVAAEMERESTEKALSAKEHQYRSLFRNLTSAFALHEIILDHTLTPCDYRFLDVNPAFEKITGLKAADLIGKTVLEVMPDTESYWITTYGAVAQSGISVEFENYSGELDKHYAVTAYSPERGKFATLFLDITQRKQMEKALAESEEKFRNFAESALVGICLVQEGVLTYANPRFAEIYGYAVDDLNDQMPLSRLIHPEDLPLVERRIRDRESGIRPVVQYTFRGIRKTGETIHVEAFGSAIEVGGRRAAMATVMDISQRKNTENELLKLVEAVHQASEGIVITTTDGIIEYANPAFENITGYDSAELMGQNPRILKSGVQNTLFYRELWETLVAGNRWTGKMVNKRKNGSLYTAECSISPVKNSDDEIVNFVWVTRDISKELDLEKRLSQAQRLEAIGSLAGGIAHDFNNLLFPITGMAELLLEELSADDAYREYLEEIHNAAKRAGDLVKQILSFSRQSDHQKMPVRISKIMQEVLKLSRSTIPSNIRIEHQIQEDCGLVIADATQVHQIAMNLVTNAFHAVEENNGTITVAVEDITLSPEHLTDLSLGPGRYVMLRVTDTGHGIAPEAINKIFEPYFTTKKFGKGTGLGLSVVYGLVKDHEGDIRVESELGKGSRFEVYLPVVSKTTDKTMQTIVKSDQTGNETILVVDDEPAVARIMQQILERLGYTVFVRTGSMEALEFFKADPYRIDLVVSDMTMPNMTGERLAGEIKTLRPEIPVVLCTGFSEKIDPDTMDRLGISGLLMKPVVKSELAQMMRHALDKSHGVATGKDNRK